MAKELISQHLACLMYVFQVKSCVYSLIGIQHSQHHQVINIGETALDEETFDEYLANMRGHYIADKVSS